MDFPSLRSPGEGTSPPPARNWKNIVVDSDPSSKDIPLSFFPKELEIIPFAGERLTKGAEHWNMCLVGYSVGRRPFYEALLNAIRNTWTLKGSFQLLSLSEGFFLLRFTAMEDYDMAWSKGVWFFLGKPFLLQKWSPKFCPKRENLTSVPIWVKIHDLPLVCWNSEGISRIASKIGIPLAVDALTAQRTRLTFARVCVQVSADASYRDEIPISLEDEIFSLKVQYEWKPTPCEHCKSLTHYSASCPSKPETTANTIPENRNNAPNTTTTATARGRSKSRRPTSRNTSTSPHIRNARYQPDHNSTISTLITNPNQTQPTKALSSSHPPSPTSHPHLANIVEAELLPPTPSPSLKPQIPNLNTPTEESSFSTSITLPTCPSSHLANPTSPNKFGVLQTVEEEQELSAGSSSKDLEAENVSSLGEFSAPPSTRSQNQKSAKGKQAKKTPHHHNYSQPFLLSVIYASNDRDSRTCLWDHIRSSVPSQDIPWIIMGDFNCCRFASDKLGGNVLSQSSMGEFNSMIFDTKLTDMHSIGNKYTWFNQRQDCPIHIKLDRVLVNDFWLHNFPNTYYFVQAPSCSDHCPLILQNTDTSHANHRFMFKNYWTSLDCFWYIVLDVFSIRSVGNPISDFCGKLKLLKSRIKREPWANSTAIQDHLDDLHSKQTAYLGLLSAEPNNPSLNSYLKHINKQILDSSHMHSSWIIQRAKASWLSQGEDNLKFLYAKIKRRMALRNSALNLSTSSSPLRADEVNGWNANLLSFAGRLQYLKFTMINSIAYWIRGSIMPKSVTKFLRKIASKFFLFGDASVGRKLHMVAWDNVCMPKSKGGLGLYSFPALVYGFNCSLILRFSNYTYPLADWISAKYGSPWLLPPSNASPFWKDICCTAQAANNYFTFDMTNAFVRRVKWKDMEKHSFRDFMEGFYSNLPDCFWANYVWHKNSALRFSVFAWLALRGGLKTAVELNRHNIHKGKKRCGGKEKKRKKKTREREEGRRGKGKKSPVGRKRKSGAEFGWGRDGDDRDGLGPHTRERLRWRRRRRVNLAMVATASATGEPNGRKRLAASCCVSKGTWVWCLANKELREERGFARSSAWASSNGGGRGNSTNRKKRRELELGMVRMESVPESWPGLYEQGESFAALGITRPWGTTRGLLLRSRCYTSNKTLAPLISQKEYMHLC
ncbi:hypothetical protein M5K25_000999 [Dendrobium thyrsiflorum]|uniref:DUF4283 domain-containing protein n=1 Tax=Dendrobium thyrsiflorum TaxID=117978 RepID=A0ABD0VV71_DENTH